MTGELAQRIDRGRYAVGGIASTVLTRGTRTSVWRPPTQWINKTASLFASSSSQTISRARIWTRRCLVLISVDGAFQAAGRSWASCRRSSRSIFGRGGDAD